MRFTRGEGGFGGMLLRENFLKLCNLVHFSVYLNQILTLKNFKNYHFCLYKNFKNYEFLYKHKLCQLNTYGCELYGMLNYNVVEKFYLKFLKRTLNVKMSTSTTMIYAETGRYPLTLSDPGYFRQLTIRGGGALKAMSKTIVSIFTISYM